MPPKFETDVFDTALMNLAAFDATKNSCLPVDDGVVAAKVAQYMADLCGVSPEQVSVELNNSSAREQ